MFIYISEFGTQFVKDYRNSINNKILFQQQIYKNFKYKNILNRDILYFYTLFI